MSMLKTILIGTGLVGVGTVVGIVVERKLLKGREVKILPSHTKVAELELFKKNNSPAPAAPTTPSQAAPATPAVPTESNPAPAGGFQAKSAKGQMRSMRRKERQELRKLVS